MTPNMDKSVIQNKLSSLKESQSLGQPLIPFRYFVISLFFASAVITFATRCVLNVAILAMVGVRKDPISETNQTVTREEITFDWDQKTQGVLLGAYFYTYTAVQILAGIIADKVNPVHLMTFTQIIASACTFISPIAAEVNIFYLIAARMVLGFVHGTMFPACYILMERWLPPAEVAVAQSLVAFGCNFGVFGVMPLTAWLCENGFAGGWPSAFYVVSAVNILFVALWTLVMSSKPSTNRYITASENDYLDRVVSKQPKTKMNTPWLKMLTSKPLWAVMFARGLNGIGYYTINSKIPVFLEYVLNYKLQGNGLVNSLFYIGICTTQLISGPLSKRIIMKGWLSVTFTRKIFESMGMIGTGLCLLSIPFLGNEPILIVACLVLSMFLMGLNVGGDIPIVPEMAPHLVGTAFGFANTLGCSAGFIAPLFIGFVLGDEVYSQSKWNAVFYIVAGLQFVGAALFAIFATAKPQSWGSIHGNAKKIPTNIPNKF